MKLKISVLLFCFTATMKGMVPAPAPKASELIYAAQANNYKAVTEYLEKGGDINVRHEYSGEHALSVAVIFGHESMFNLLLQKNANLNVQDNLGKTILFYDRCTPKMFRTALERGADPNIKDKLGRTVIMYWIEGRPFVAAQSYRVALLLKYGAKIDIADNGGKTVRDYAGNGWLKKYLDMDASELEKEIAAYC